MLTRGIWENNKTVRAFENMKQNLSVFWKTKLLWNFPDDYYETIYMLGITLLTNTSVTGAEDFLLSDVSLEGVWFNPAG